MLNNTSLFVLISIVIAWSPLQAQNRIDLSFSVSNQGPVDQYLEDFYVNAHPTALQDDATLGSDLRFKANFTLDYTLSDSSVIRIRFGRGVRNAEYTQDLPNSKWTANDRQVFHEIAVSYGWTTPLKSVSLSYGVEIPFYLIGDHTQDMTYQYFNDPGILATESVQSLTMGGGYAAGLGSFLTVRRHLSEQFFIQSELNFGVLYITTGDVLETQMETVFPADASTELVRNKEADRFLVAPPQFQFGLGFSF